MNYLISSYSFLSLNYILRFLCILENVEKDKCYFPRFRCRFSAKEASWELPSTILLHIAYLTELKTMKGAYLIATLQIFLKLKTYSLQF